jgi:chitodextrinase
MVSVITKGRFAFSGVIFMIAVVLFALITLHKSSAATNGLVAAYGFNESSGVAATDSSGNNNNGTISNATRSTSGKYGGALSFNGAKKNNYVSIPDSTPLHLTSGMTLEAWINPASVTGSWRTVILKERPGGMAYSLYANNDANRPVGQIFNTAERNAQGTASVALNTWTHLSTTYDGSSLRLYVNGVQVSSVPASGNIINSTGLLKIGGNAVWGEWFNGLIDEVRVYNRALSAAEIQTDMNTPVEQSAPDTTPPSVPGSFAVTSTSTNSIATGWTTSTDNVAVAQYEIYKNSALVATTPGTSYTLTGLSCGTTYNISVDAVDTSNNRSAQAFLTAATSACDTTTPSVEVSSPANGATITGVVPLAANASDDRGVAGVQFKVDGNNIGAEDTTAPYTADWNSVSAVNSSHDLTAVVRDNSGNSTTSNKITVNVVNTLNTGDALKKVTVGPGYTHDAAREPVRTPNGMVYIFASDDTAEKKGTGPGVIHAWKGDRAGIPTSFAEVDAANHPSGPAGTLNVVGSPDVRLDRSGVVHLFYTRQADQTVVYQTFSTLTDTWGPVEVVDTGVAISYTSSLMKRDTSNALILDGNDMPHFVYSKDGSLMYRNRLGGIWSGPVTLDTAATPKHPLMAFDQSGNLHVSWLQDGSPSTVKYKLRQPNGNWNASETVSSGDVLNNSTEDQGPSIVVTAAGVPYVQYITPQDFVRVKYKSGGSWVYDNLPTSVYTHAPQIYARGNDIYVFLGHDSNIDYAYLYQLGGAGNSWSNVIKLSTGQSVDGSASVRWDPQRETNPNVIDSLFFDEDINDDSSYIGTLYYEAVLPSNPPDSVAPISPSNLAITSQGEGTIGVSWTGSTDNVGVAGYGLYVGSQLVSTTSGTAYTFANLHCNASFTLGIDAFDAGGNHSTKTTITASTGACDSSPPTVQLTSPASGATVSGVINLSASATDNTGIAGVQFQVDGINFGSEVTTPPYAIDWNSQLIANGSHTITVIARDLSSNTVTASATITVSNTGSSAPGLVAAYSFNTVSGASIGDSSGKGNVGTTNNITWSTSGKFGGALSFNGASSYVSILDSSSLDLTTGMTLEAWINPSLLGSGGATWKTVLFKELPGGMAYSLYANNNVGRPTGQVNVSGEKNAAGTSQLPVNAWSHLTTTYDGSALRLYVNGALVSTTSVSGNISVSNGALKIGGNSVWGEWYSGLIDEVHIYNRALSASEIQTDMNTPIP